MREKKSNSKKLHNLKIEQKKQHQREVANKVKATQHNYARRLYHYQQTKKLRWYDYVAIIVLTMIILAVSFLFSIFAFNNIQKTQWIIVGFLAIIALSWLMVGWYKNKKAATYFNDIRKRYEPTLTNQEATLKKTQKYLLLISLLLIVSSIIVFAATNS